MSNKEKKEKIIDILEQGFSDMSENEKKTNKVKAELILELLKAQRKEIIKILKSKEILNKSLEEIINRIKEI